MSQLLSRQQLDDFIHNIIKDGENEESIQMYIENIDHEYHEQNYNLHYQLLNKLNQIDSFDPYNEAARFAPPPHLQGMVEPTISDYSHAEYPVVRYAKVYIQYMSGDYGEFEQEKIMPLLEPQSSTEKDFISNHTFNCKLNKEQLSSFYDKLSSSKIISGEKEVFIKIFSNKHSSQVKPNKIIWLLRYSHGINAQALLTFLDLMSPDEYLSLPHRSDYFNKIELYFSKLNKQEEEIEISGESMTEAMRDYSRLNWKKNQVDVKNLKGAKLTIAKLYNELFETHS